MDPSNKYIKQVCVGTCLWASVEGNEGVTWPVLVVEAIGIKLRGVLPYLFRSTHRKGREYYICLSTRIITQKITVSIYTLHTTLHATHIATSIHTPLGTLKPLLGRMSSPTALRISRGTEGYNLFVWAGGCFSVCTIVQKERNYRRVSSSTCCNSTEDLICWSVGCCP